MLKKQNGLDNKTEAALINKDIISEIINQNKGIDFWGNSFICGPQGEILADGNTEAGTIFADIDLDKSERTRRIWPFLRDRRIDAYGDLIRISSE